MPDKGFKKKYKLIKDFQTKAELVDHVALQMIDEFQKSGLILLSAGKTFEAEIYPRVNNFFKSHKKKIHPNLILSLVDERITDYEDYLFATSVDKALSSLHDKFRTIDINDPKAFDTFIKGGGGPKTIYFGLGLDPTRAHVAFIGEEYINSTTTRISLSDSERPIEEITQAITVGADIFKSDNLENIYVVAIGKEKSESLKAAFNDVDTGLGYLIEHYPEKLSILCDSEAASLLKEDLH